MVPFGMAFAGGGTRGAAHVGVLMALEEHGLKPDAVSGASAGGIVAGLYAAGFTAKELHEVVKELSKKGMLLVDPAYGDIFLALGQFISRRPLSLSGVLKGNRLERYLDTLTEGKKLCQLSMRTVIPAVDLISGLVVSYTNHLFGVRPMRGVTWENEATLSEAMRASAAVPAVFRPKAIGKRRLVDGGVVDILPVDLLVAAGEENVLAVDISGSYQCPKHLDILEVASHSLGILQDSLRECKTRGERLLLKPALPEDAGLLTFSQMEDCVQAGYEAASRMIPTIRALFSLQEDSGERGRKMAR